MTSKARAQTSMDETPIEMPELEALLEDREELKNSVSEYRKVDQKAKALIRTVEAPSPFRVGRFVITRSVRPGRAVAFETQESISFTIKTAGEE